MFLALYEVMCMFMQFSLFCHNQPFLYSQLQFVDLIYGQIGEKYIDELPKVRWFLARIWENAYKIR